MSLLTGTVPTNKSLLTGTVFQSITSFILKMAMTLSMKLSKKTGKLIFFNISFYTIKQFIHHLEIIATATIPAKCMKEDLIVRTNNSHYTYLMVL